MIFRKKQVKVEAKPEHSTLVSTSTLTSSTTKEEFWALKNINFEIEMAGTLPAGFFIIFGRGSVYKQ